MIPPTIGRVLWYYPSAKVEQPWPALCCFVHGNNEVNIGGFRADGTPFDAANVPLVQEGDPKLDRNYCTWMPYQIKATADAGAKTDSAATKTEHSLASAKPFTSLKPK